MCKHFRKIFGFSKAGFRFVLDLILPQIQAANSNHREYLPPVNKLCIFLDFLRSNSFQRVVGTQHHNRVSQSRSCIIINEIAHIIAGLHTEVINFSITLELKDNGGPKTSPSCLRSANIHFNKRCPQLGGEVKGMCDRM